MLKFGLIGFPLKNTYSVDFMNNSFKSLNIKALYSNYEIDTILGLRNFIQTKTLNGFNVTQPYKKLVIPYLDSLDKIAESTGSVNTVCLENNGYRGYNTDVNGLLSTFNKYSLYNKNYALIIGNGGVSNSVKFVLKNFNIPYEVVARTPVDGEYNFNFLSPSNTPKFDLLIQCTPLGMFPSTNQAPPIPYHLLNTGAFALDLIYNPSETLFMKKCADFGLSTANGLHMLHEQATKALEIWFR